MNKRSYLLNRRRNRVLLNRHVRMVSQRHIQHQDYAKPRKVTEIVDVDTVEAVKETVEITQDKTKEELAAEKLKAKEEEKRKREEAAQRRKLEKQAKAEEKKRLKALKKERKKQYKEEEIDRLISEPSTSLFLIISNPFLCMDKVSEVDYATLSSGQRFVVHLIKWLAIGACFASLIAYFININPFGFSRLNFTATSMVAIKFALFCMVCEILSSYCISLFCFSRKQPFDRARFVSIYTYGAIDEIILFILSVVLMHFAIYFGIALFVGSIFVSIYIKCYGICKTDLPKRRFLFGSIVLCFVFTLLFFTFAQFAGADVIKILKNIMNI